jgi:hypothetical protein
MNGPTDPKAVLRTFLEVVHDLENWWANEEFSLIGAGFDESTREEHEAEYAQIQERLEAVKVKAREIVVSA